MAQPVGLAQRPFRLRPMASDGRLGTAPRLPQPLDRVGLQFQAAIGIEQPAVGAGIDQRAGIVLAMDFHQRGAQRLERLHADRLFVDKGPRAAVGKLHPAQDQRLVGRDLHTGREGSGPDGASGSSNIAVTCPWSAP